EHLLEHLPPRRLVFSTVHRYQPAGLRIEYMHEPSRVFVPDTSHDAKTLTFNRLGKFPHPASSGVGCFKVFVNDGDRKSLVKFHEPTSLDEVFYGSLAVTPQRRGSLGPRLHGTRHAAPRRR